MGFAGTTLLGRSARRRAGHRRHRRHTPRCAVGVALRTHGACLVSPPAATGYPRGVNEQLQELRDAVKQQLGTERPPAADVDPAELTRFSPDLPDRLDPERRAELERRAGELAPWLQGPFLLGGDLVVGGAWRNDTRWMGLGPELPQDMSGMRVLDVGSNAGYDPFMFKLRGADHVLACEPFLFIEQAQFLEQLYRSGVDFRQIGWEALDPAVHGRFDLVHCHGVLYHEPHPLAMLMRLREMLADDGKLLFGSMQLADVEL